MRGYGAPAIPRGNDEIKSDAAYETSPYREVSISGSDQPPSFFLKSVLNSADISSGTYLLLPEVADT
jgi:hypothetical protein